MFLECMNSISSITHNKKLNVSSVQICVSVRHKWLMPAILPLRKLSRRRAVSLRPACVREWQVVSLHYVFMLEKGAGEDRAAAGWQMCSWLGKWECSDGFFFFRQLPFLQDNWYMKNQLSCYEPGRQQITNTLNFHYNFKLGISQTYNPVMTRVRQKELQLEVS